LNKKSIEDSANKILFKNENINNTKKHDNNKEFSKVQKKGKSIEDWIDEDLPEDYEDKNFVKIPENGKEIVKPQKKGKLTEEDPENYEKNYFNEYTKNVKPQKIGKSIEDWIDEDLPDEK
jgi:hypothetical protein